MSYYAKPHHAPMRLPDAESIARRVEAGRADAVAPDDLRQAYRILSEGGCAITMGEIHRNREKAAAIYRHLVEHGEIANV